MVHNSRTAATLLTVSVLFAFGFISLSVAGSEEPSSVASAEEALVVEEDIEESSSEPEAKLEAVEATLINETAANETIAANATVQKFVQCLPEMGQPQVQLVNDTELIKLLLVQSNITSKETPALCVLVLFYSMYCPFSSMAAPHFNALPRAFPDVKMVAINAMTYHLLNTQNGIVGVPSLVLFHNGRPVGRFNESEYTLELFSRFLTKHSGIQAMEMAHVTSADFSGPVSSVPNKDVDMFLIMAWLFIAGCGSYYFTKSRLWTWVVEVVQRNWRESEAQARHEHGD